MAVIRTERDLIDYLVSYARDVAIGDDDPAELLDRFHTPDIIWVSDGVQFDRERLLAHARPARRNVLTCSVEVHSALLAGDSVAAHYTLSARMRKERVLDTEIMMVGHLATDSRLTRIDQLTRTIADAAVSESSAGAPDGS